MKAYAETLPEPSRTLMTYVNDRAVDKLGPILLPVADGLKNHPGDAGALGRTRGAATRAGPAAARRRRQRHPVDGDRAARRAPEGQGRGHGPAERPDHARRGQPHAEPHRSVATRAVLARADNEPSEQRHWARRSSAEDPLDGRRRVAPRVGADDSRGPRHRERRDRARAGHQGRSREGRHQGRRPPHQARRQGPLHRPLQAEGLRHDAGAIPRAGRRSWT